MRTSEQSQSITGSIGEYDPWPGGIGPKGRAARIMERQQRPTDETVTAVTNAGTHVRGSMALMWSGTTRRGRG
jgi:hypothetical protein